MNTGEKIDYMIQCLQVAKAECEHLDEWNVRDWQMIGMQIGYFHTGHQTSH